MIWINKPFDSYELRLYTGNGEKAAELRCYDGESYVGTMTFFADGGKVPLDTLVDPSVAAPGGIALDLDERIELRMPMSRFDTVMSTVRSEKPLCLQIGIQKKNTAGWMSEGNGHLATTEKEPVGEDEAGLG